MRKRILISNVIIISLIRLSGKLDFLEISSPDVSSVFATLAQKRNLEHPNGLPKYCRVELTLFPCLAIAS